MIRFVLVLCLALSSCSASSGDGWTVTVYYTAVASFHDGATERVTGCPRLECSSGTDDLGTYPSSFVRAVRDEGTGRIDAGRYLNWSVDVGFWLDSAPRDSAGGVLEPWRSAAADADVLGAGKQFTIASCGPADDVAAEVCDRLREARWIIRDEFTPGLGGDRHVDVYIGEETGPAFTESEWYTTLENARLTFS
ncbi:hypothetical protein [Virgisporangium aurantiacum]|uniref:Lipoprotein n=1 Tax=Virgisporangium aurantiacum TaxID=175570 RepID=A0A8J4DYS1_9ACTN|nr:hypothetical protein [Virgisporangium aurantiacum]GIJ55945.1 hypothetical protein Vau01_034610 [Virgisporangium aurantiacum]